MLNEVLSNTGKSMQKVFGSHLNAENKDVRKTLRNHILNLQKRKVFGKDATVQQSAQGATIKPDEHQLPDYKRVFNHGRLTYGSKIDLLREANTKSKLDTKSLKN